MKIKKIYFSPTGNSKKIADEAVKALHANILDVQAFDITKPGNREKEIFVNKDELLVISMPIYASRLPNKIMPFVRENIKSNGAKAICFVTYGNRSYGDGLAELCGLLEDNGFEIIGAGVVPSEHAFAKIAEGRPNAKDLEEVGSYVSDLMKRGLEAQTEIEIPGEYPAGAYYRPLRNDGVPAVFLKATPKTDVDKCIHCGYCQMACPMNSISPADYSLITGICIKCQACVKNCKMGAKYFDDEDFLSHKEMLEENFNDKKENEFFY